MVRPVRRLLALAVLAALVPAAFPSASAHEEFDAGQYRIEVGWQSEPPMVDQPNAIVVTVMDTSGGNETPVGTDDVALMPQIRFGSDSKDLALVGSDDEPGLYVAAVVPTEAGDYTLHVAGTVGGVHVDHTVQLDEVQEASESAFPKSHKGLGDLQGDIAMLQVEALCAAGLALVLAIVALALAVGARSRSREAMEQAASRTGAPPRGPAQR